MTIGRALALVVATAASVATGGRFEARCQTTGSCGFQDLVVSAADPAQAADVCAAIAEVQAFLAAIGFSFEPSLTVIFRTNIDAEAGERHAHGFYNPALRKAVLYARERAKPWGEPWSEIAGSFLRHELVHAAVVQIISARKLNLQPEWHEFIAYAIQFELMAPTLRDRIVDRYTHVEPVRTLTEINPFTYGMADPAGFAVMAFKTYRVFGERELIRRLLAGEFVPTPLELMMPFPPR